MVSQFSILRENLFFSDEQSRINRFSLGTSTKAKYNNNKKKYKSVSLSDVL